VFKKYNILLYILLFLIIIIGLALTDLLNGSIKVNFTDTFNVLFNGHYSDNSLSTIFFEIRIPRILTAISAGLALSVCGLLMQTLFRNPLAGPYVLGVSSGAGLGVALMVLGFSAFGLNIAPWLGGGGIIIAACLGSGLFMTLIFIVSLKVKDIMTLLVLGILLGSAASAIINVFQVAGSEQSLKLFVLWTMGSLSNTTWSQWVIMTSVIIIGILLAAFMAYRLNIWLLGEENAKASGVNIIQVRNILFLSSTLLAGSVTAFCGPLAFVGIAAPHIARIILKTSDHRILIPFSGLVGIAMMLIADILTQLPGSVYTLPINTTTSLLGLPIVFWIVIKGKKMWS
jgi:iron complex transport system permease protein